MKFLKLYVLVNVFILIGSIVKSQQEEIPVSGLNTSTWAEDIKYLQKNLIERHANVYHTISRKNLENDFRNLLSNLGKLKTEDIIIRLSEILASIGDSHTWLDFRENKLFAFHFLPLALEYFEDGLYVINATDKYIDIIGKRIVSINKIPIDDVFNLVSMLGYRENEYTSKFSVPRFLPILEVLRYYEIANQEDIVLEFENKSSAIIALNDCQLKPTLYNYLEESNPLYLKNRNKTFWFSELENGKHLYIQINKCQDDTEKTLVTFAEEIVNKIEGAIYQSVVLDLRNNFGGNSKLMYPLVYALQTYNRKSPEGKLFVAISRNTLSASVVFCDEIKKFCKAYFIGEPSGAKPNLYGENSYFISLPNSKLQVSFSSEYFQAAGPFNKNDFVITDIYKPLTSQDFFGRNDPVLNFITETSNSIFLFESIFQKFISEGKYVLAINLLDSHSRLPENKYLDIEQLIRRAANRLMKDSTIKYSKQLYDLNMKIYPERALPYLSLAEYFNGIKEYNTAVQYYEKAKILLKTDQFIYSAYRYRLEDAINASLKEINDKKFKYGR